MFDSVKKFLAELSADASAQGSFEANDFRLAAAALLVHIAEIDGEFDAREQARLQAIVETRFSLNKGQARELIKHAAESERDSVDLDRFTSVLKRMLSEDERRQVVAMLWEIAYADGEIHEFEENVVKRITELLGVPTRDGDQQKTQD
jgi:uncharacterized tellurite resistance protein B-like protein